MGVSVYRCLFLKILREKNIFIYVPILLLNFLVQIFIVIICTTLRIRSLIRSPFQTFLKEGMMLCRVAEERLSHLYISFSLIFCIFPKLP